MDKLLKQLELIKTEQQQLKQLKVQESKEQQKFISNCKKLLKCHKQQKQDYLLENLIQLNESASCLSTDIEGFKSIRQRLFQQASASEEPNDKLYLYLFHLFESLVCNVSTLLSKCSHQLISQCPQELFTNTQINKFSTTTCKKKEGFFSKNYQSLIKNKEQIENIIDQIQKDQKQNEYKDRKSQQALKRFFQEIKQQQQNQSTDNSFDVKWSLQELENIVFEFVNPQVVTNQFQEKRLKLDDVNKEDILKVKQAEIDNQLPLMVRDYILQDRGNSLFLSESFANLPSPVNESQTMKQLFKVKEEDELEKNQNQHQNLDTKSNNQIKIEGKDFDDEDNEKKEMVDIDVKDIDKVVFREQANHNKQKSLYEEEESYLNPSNISYTDESQQDHKRLDSIPYSLKCGQPRRYIRRQSDKQNSEASQNTINLNFNDIQLGEQQNQQNSQKQNTSQISNQSDNSQQQKVPFERNSFSSNPYINKEESTYKSDVENKLIIQQEDRESNQPQVVIQNITNPELMDQSVSIDHVSLKSQRPSVNYIQNEQQRFRKSSLRNKPIPEEDHSSCKNTVKMSEQSQFSFIKEVKPTLAKGSIDNQKFNSGIPNNVQDTVTRLQGINSSRSGEALKNMKFNPFKVDTSTINDKQESKKLNGSGAKSQRNQKQGYQKEMPVQVKGRKKSRNSVNSKNSQSEQRTISPSQKQGVQMTYNDQGQNNMQRCISLKDLEQLAIKKFPQNNNMQSITNKHSVSTYDSLTQRSNQTPGVGSFQAFMSKDPSKRSIESYKSKNQNKKQGQEGAPSVKQSLYLKVLENKVEKTKQKNVDALKMVLNSYQSSDSRNYISQPQLSQPTMFGGSNMTKEPKKSRNGSRTNSNSTREAHKVKNNKRKSGDYRKKSEGKQTSRRCSKDNKSKQGQMTSLPEIQK